MTDSVFLFCFKNLPGEKGGESDPDAQTVWGPVSDQRNNENSPVAQLVPKTRVLTP